MTASLVDVVMTLGLSNMKIMIETENDVLWVEVDDEVVITGASPNVREYWVK